MKKILMALAIVVCTATVACAAWLVDFKDNYAAKGIDVAVEQAMKVGINPDPIMENGLALENLNPENLIKALYCAGAKGQDIRDAAKKYGISGLILTAGFKKSVAECGDKVADTQAYTPVGAPMISGPPSPPGGHNYSSPSTF